MVQRQGSINERLYKESFESVERKQQRILKIDLVEKQKRNTPKTSLLSNVIVTTKLKRKFDKIMLEYYDSIYIKG